MWSGLWLPKSAYGVISQRIRLNPDPENKFRQRLISQLGAAMVQFRPLDEIEEIQLLHNVQQAVPPTDIEDKPCSYNTMRAVLDAADYGRITDWSSRLYLEVVPGFNLIGEWSGRNLNLGFSVRPFP